MRKVTLIDYLSRKKQQKIRAKFDEDFDLKVKDRRKWVKEHKWWNMIEIKVRPYDNGWVDFSISPITKK